MASLLHAPTHQVGQKHTADHQSDENGRGGEAETRDRSCNGGSPVCRQRCRTFSAHRAKGCGEFSHPLLDERGDSKYLVVLISADKGLAGAFNANVIKATQAFLKKHDGKVGEMIPVGRKGRDFFKRRDVKFADEYVGLTGSGQVVRRRRRDLKQGHRDVYRGYNDRQGICRFYRIQNRFVAKAGHSATVAYPANRCRRHDEAAGTQLKYLYEQPADEIFGRLLPKQVEIQIYKGMLESVASEQGSRMTAMDSASKNAGELIDNLTLNMNRIRQAAITKEIIEVVSCAAAQ